MLRRRGYVVFHRRRWRRWLRRRSVHWISMGLLAVATLAVFVTAAVHIDASRRAWGTARTIVVARRAIEPGTVIAADDVDRRAWPDGLLPDGFYEQPPLGHTVRAPVAKGEPLVRDRIAPDGVSGLAAQVPAGRVAVAIPSGTAALRVAPGDTVTLIGSQGDTVSDSALVVAVDDKAITVAVRESDAPAVVAALAAGAVVPALRGG